MVGVGVGGGAGGVCTGEMEEGSGEGELGNRRSAHRNALMIWRLYIYDRRWGEGMGVVVVVVKINRISR